MSSESPGRSCSAPSRSCGYSSTRQMLISLFCLCLCLSWLVLVFVPVPVPSLPLACLPAMAPARPTNLIEMMKNQSNMKGNKLKNHVMKQQIVKIY